MFFLKFSVTTQTETQINPVQTSGLSCVEGKEPIDFFPTRYKPAALKVVSEVCGPPPGES